LAENKILFLELPFGSVTSVFLTEKKTEEEEPEEEEEEGLSLARP